jgi:hypothetical protein
MRREWDFPNTPFLKICNIFKTYVVLIAVLSGVLLGLNGVLLGLNGVLLGLNGVLLGLNGVLLGRGGFAICIRQ